ncbi:MAG TPA: YtfJ family protein [Spirochaetota bacterium]|nr:YtfJ family protein [Spirochaetota bacterium]HRZ28296.1 YtfJ family protein [Spirochaetota bacterium]HSA14148.1 YtfJ family protein [Spirochaetota bacterium]
MVKKSCFIASIFALLVVFGAVIGSAGDIQQLVGKQLPAIKLLTLDANEKWVDGDMPQLGKKVLSIMYTDADKSDMNDPLSDAINAKDYPKDKYQGIGIGNSKDAPWIMDALIRSIAKGKMKKYKGSIILLDETLAFAQKLGLGDCNDKAVVMIVDKTGKILYIKKISSEKESTAMIPEVLKILDATIK